MKKVIILSVSAMLAYTAAQVCGCGNCKKTNAQTLALAENFKGEPKTVTLKITGMTCSGCSNHISSALSKKDGILAQEVKFPGDVAIVKYDPDKITEKEIIATIEKAGYKAEVKKDDGSNEGTKEKKCKPGYKKSCCSKKIKYADTLMLYRADNNNCNLIISQ
jgi:copper chaperone CopZ